MQFDYIIVGAGSAGCVLANRLSTNPANKVLLIEAGGPDKKMEIHIPAAYPKLHRSKVDWGFWTEPQKHVYDRKIYLPRGKTLGGSSSTNAMAYVRGNQADYNEWADLGNKGWSYQEVLPYFKQSENNEQIYNEYHSQGGLLNVTHAKSFRTPFAGAFMQACQEVGISENQDYNGAEQEGAFYFQFTIKNGQRHSTATAFLKPALSRPNLKVITKAPVKQILLENDKAVGVEFFTGKNQSEKALASKEVILSAGAFQSPQLLMLSGIGEAEVLKKQGILVKKNLMGVGKNLQDHLYFSVSCFSTEQVGVNHRLSILNQLKDLLYYFLTKKGSMTISPLETGAFLRTYGAAHTNLQFHFAPFCSGDSYAIDIHNLDTYPRADGYSILPSLIKPKSRGYVSLNSSNPLDTPLIQPNFLSEEDDLKVLVEGGKKALDIVKAQAFKPFYKGIALPQNLSEEGIIDHIKRQLETIYHPVGTCKMGNDERAVVDNELRVHGIENLRVVDGSIMPTIVAGNTNAPIIMIAEKAAALIGQ